LGWRCPPCPRPNPKFKNHVTAGLHLVSLSGLAGCSENDSVRPGPDADTCPSFFPESSSQCEAAPTADGDATLDAVRAGMAFFADCGVTLKREIGRLRLRGLVGRG